MVHSCFLYSYLRHDLLQNNSEGRVTVAMVAGSTTVIKPKVSPTTTNPSRRRHLLRAALWTAGAAFDNTCLQSAVFLWVQLPVVSWPSDTPKLAGNCGRQPAVHTHTQCPCLGWIISNTEEDQDRNKQQFKHSADSLNLSKEMGSLRFPGLKFPIGHVKVLLKALPAPLCRLHFSCGKIWEATAASWPRKHRGQRCKGSVANLNQHFFVYFF